MVGHASVRTKLVWPMCVPGMRWSWLPNALETDEIQSLVFGRMGRLKCSEMIALRFPVDAKDNAGAGNAEVRRWLQGMMAMEKDQAAYVAIAEMFKNGPRIINGVLVARRCGLRQIVSPLLDDPCSGCADLK